MSIKSLFENKCQENSPTLQRCIRLNEIARAQIEDINKIIRPAYNGTIDNDQVMFRTRSTDTTENSIYINRSKKRSPFPKAFPIETVMFLDIINKDQALMVVRFSETDDLPDDSLFVDFDRDSIFNEFEKTEKIGREYDPHNPYIDDEDCRWFRIPTDENGITPEAFEKVLEDVIWTWMDEEERIKLMTYYEMHKHELDLRQ